jgi:hypothetical protein
MKLIIAGSREISLSVDELDELMKKHFEVSEITEVVSGCAKGMDTSGIQWANKYNIPIKKFVPDWSMGKAAGHIRNREMGDYADQAIVVYNGSNGSQGMIDYMQKLKKPCVVINKN